MGYGVRRSSCRAHIEMMHYAALKEDPVCCTIAAASRPLYAHYTRLSKTVLANSKGLLSGFCRTWHQQATETTAHCRMAEDVVTVQKPMGPLTVSQSHSSATLPMIINMKTCHIQVHKDDRAANKAQKPTGRPQSTSIYMQAHPGFKKHIL